MAISSNGLAGLKPGVVDNAAARPSSPFEGQMIYQKDTDAVLVWNGTAWYPNWNLPWGKVAYNEVTADDATITLTEEVQITGSSFTAVAGRQYRITYYEPQLNNTAATYFVLRIRLTNLTGTEIGRAIPSVSANNYAFGNCIRVATLTGTVTLVGTLESTGTGSATRSGAFPAFLLVEDIGPA
jgi:hypothetical protein